jgi:hypothetical protein
MTSSVRWQNRKESILTQPNAVKRDLRHSQKRVKCSYRYLINQRGFGGSGHFSRTGLERGSIDDTIRNIMP